MNTNLTLTLYDILSYFIPGSILILVLRYFTRNSIGIDNALLLPAFFVLSYFAGVALHVTGTILYAGIYKEDFKEGGFIRMIIKFIDRVIKISYPFKIKRNFLDVKKNLAKLLSKKYKIETKKDNLLLFAVADAYMANKAYSEREILSAKESFYRASSALVFILTCFAFVFLKNTIYTALVVSLTGFILLYILIHFREFYRTIRNQQIYIISYMSILHE